MKLEEADDMRCCGPEGCGNLNNGERWCITTECMAWRWKNIPNPDYKGGVMMSMPRPEVPMYLKSDAEGYCGLAGHE